MRLARLIATDEKQNESGAAPGEIEPITRPVVNAQLAHTSANRPRVTNIPLSQPKHPSQNEVARSLITQAR